MLLTRVKPAELWGKKVYNTEGRHVGHVVAIAGRRGVVHKVVVHMLVVPVSTRPQLRVVP